MKTPGHRRNGIASLPISIFFIVLVAVAAAAVGMAASGQSHLANEQLGAESLAAARQAELNGLSVTTAGSNDLLVTQTAGTPTEIVYSLIATTDGQTYVKPTDYISGGGQTTTIDLLSLVQSVFGGNVPNLKSITFVTANGLYVTSQVQTIQKTEQVTTYEQQQVQKTGQKLVGYEVSVTSTAYYSCAGVVSNSALCNTSYPATPRSNYSCPSWETLVQDRSGSWVCLGTSIQVSSPVVTVTPGYYTCSSGWSLSGSTCSRQQTYYTWVPGYYSSEQVPYYVPGYWSQYFVSGYWSSYSYGYTTYQRVQTGGYWTIQWIHVSGQQWCMFGCDFPEFVWVPTYSWIAVVHYVTVEVWHPGYWASYYVSGYWTTQTVMVWHPGYWKTNSLTVYSSATWNPPVNAYSCPSGWSLGTTLLGPNTCERTGTYTATPLVYLTYTCNGGDTLSGTTCEHSYAAAYYPAKTTSLGQQSWCPSGSQYVCTPLYKPYSYTVTEAVPVTKTVYSTTLSSGGAGWLVGG